MTSFLPARSEHPSRRNRERAKLLRFRFPRGFRRSGSMTYATAALRCSYRWESIRSWFRRRWGTHISTAMDTYRHMIPALRNEVADPMDDIFAPTTVNEAVKPASDLIQ